jgi:hypothetical protein
MMKHPPLATLPLPTEYAVEGIFDFPALSKYISGFFGKFNSIAKDGAMLPTIIPKPEVLTAVKKISALTPVNREAYQVYGPEYLTKNFTGYLKLLDEAFSELKTIEKELLIPIEMWIANMISNDEYSKKVWTTLPSAESKISKYSETIHKYLDDSADDNLHRRPFSILYGTADGLIEADLLLRDLSQQSGSMLDGTLTKRTDSILKLMQQLLDKKNGNQLEDLTPDKIKSISNVVLRAARELELLAVILFQIKISAAAQEQTVKKINKEL